jgi:hypothetical protein
MMHYDGVSKSEMNEVIDQARARLSRKPNASEGAIIMKHRPCEGGRTDESKVGAEANGDVQPGSAPVGLPTLLAEERKKRSSPSQTSGQQCSEIAAAFKES